MAKMYRLAYGDAELPRITDFLVEYDELCEKHGLRFQAELEHGYEACDTVMNVSIIPDELRPPEYEDYFIDPELSEAIPEVAAAADRLKAEYEQAHKAREESAAVNAQTGAAIDPLPGLKMALERIGAGNTSEWVVHAKAAIAEAIVRLGKMPG